jgi:hypothetical protein
MPSPVIDVGATVQCSHAGSATVVPSTRVTLSGQAVVTVLDIYSIAGCSLSGTSTPPCATGQWTSGARRVFTMGIAVAISSGTSTCVPTGTPMQAPQTQTRVLAT